MLSHPEIYDRVHKALNNEEIIGFAQQLVQINSVNPNLEPGSGEQAIVDFLAQSASEAGLAVDYDIVVPGRPNLLCVYPGRTDQVGLLFLAHTDTVPFLEMHEPLSGENVEGHIWGRGSVDMKGGLAGAMQALVALARSNVPLEKGVALAAVVDEESEHRGAYHLAQSGCLAEACIVPEPSNLQLALGCKGTSPICIHLKGRLAHGSTPWHGINAIEKAAKVIQTLSELQPQQVRLSELGITVRGTLNVGVITGGSAYNNVADSCSIYLDRRMVPGETQQSCMAEFQAMINRLASEDPELNAELEISRPDWRWEVIRTRGLNPAYTPAQSEAVRKISKAYEDVLGSKPHMGFSNGYTDMDFAVNELGIPTVNLGPGDAALAHHLEERLPIEQLLIATRIYVRAALELASPVG